MVFPFVFALVVTNEAEATGSQLRSVPRIHRLELTALASS